MFKGSIFHCYAILLFICGILKNIQVEKMGSIILANCSLINLNLQLLEHVSTTLLKRLGVIL